VAVLRTATEISWSSDSKPLWRDVFSHSFTIPINCVHKMYSRPARLEVLTEVEAKIQAFWYMSLHHSRCFKGAGSVFKTLLITCRMMQITWIFYSRHPVHELNVMVLLIHRKKTVVTSMLQSIHVLLFHIHCHATMWSNTQQPVSAHPSGCYQDNSPNKCTLAIF
jgi:hypothetical protein